MARWIVIGDPHGCLDELRELVRKVGYRGRERGDSLLILGDFLDRGPDPAGTVAYAMALDSLRVRGNHEESALRWLRYEARAAADPSFVNPMEVQPTRTVRQTVSGTRELTPEQLEVRRRRQEAKAAKASQGSPKKPSMQRPPRPISEKRKAEWRSLSGEQLSWLENAPPWLDLPNNWLAVHAGFEPKPLAEQRVDRVIRVRYVDPLTGNMAAYTDGTMNQPNGSVRWQGVWPGPQNVVYGHAVHSKRAPWIDTRDTPTGTVRMIGIDTGCCFGGRLTAMILEEDGAFEFVQVDAARVYCEPPVI